jgi:hypothetical protein
MDRVQDIARLRALAEARGGAEREHPAALGGRGAVGQHDQPRLRKAPVQITELGSARQRAEVEERDLGTVRGERLRELVVGDAGRDQPEVVVDDQRLEASSDDVLELADRDGDDIPVDPGRETSL